MDETIIISSTIWTYGTKIWFNGGIRGWGGSTDTKISVNTCLRWKIAQEPGGSKTKACPQRSVYSSLYGELISNVSKHEEAFVDFPLLTQTNIQTNN